MNTDIIGKGIYTIPQTSKLVDLDYNTVSRWVKGYSFKKRKTEQKSQTKPVVNIDLPVLNKKFAVSFLSLIELMFVKEFRKRGLNLIEIRRAYREAAQILSTTHPFAYRKFSTDRKKIFMKISEITGNTQLIQLVERQYVIKEFIEKFLDDVVFDDQTEFAMRWWPMGKQMPVVIDPKVAFGAPRINRTRIDTETLYDSYIAERSFTSVANLFGIKVFEVKAAIAFEQKVMKKDEVYT